MGDGTTSIIELLEQADQRFRSFADVPDQALSLWNEGLDRLSAALWLYERAAHEDIPSSP